MSNAQLLERTAVRELVVTTDHTRRLLDLKGVRNWERIKQDLMDAGFRWYISAEKLNKFKHYAVVRAIQREVNYIGDIPDFAIGKAELALSLGVKELTIHSMQTLPITREHTDPIMVGWIRIPDTGWGGEFTYGTFYGWEGVVICFWDGEKELELL